MFQALITGTNEFGESRISFHVYTDGHGQMENSIDAFMDTTTKLGQTPPKIVFTDKPESDCG